MTTGTSPPYARIVGNKFDVSAYCIEPLVNSLDHLTSIRFAVFSLIRPSLKIAARSLFIEHEEITISNILSHLNTETSIISPPPEARPQRPKRSLAQRMKHFFTVGIPLAIIVGILAGILHLIKTIATDINTVFKTCYQLYTMSQRDVKFYKDNPQLLPSRNVAIDGVINSGLSYYARRLIYRKLGVFSFLAKPFIGLIERFLTKRIINFCDQIEKLRNRYRSDMPMPSAPPSHDAEYDNKKYH